MFTKALTVLLLLTVCSHAQIDLTPLASTRELDGIQFARLEFRDGPAKITYEPPRQWEAFGRGSRKLLLTPPASSQAQATIEVVDQALPEFDEAGVELLQQHTLGLLHAAGEGKKIDGAEVNGIILNNNPTCEITASVVQFGQRFKTSVLFVRLEGRHLRFQLLCREADFPRLHQAFRSSVSSWQWAQTPAPRP